MAECNVSVPNSLGLQPGKRSGLVRRGKHHTLATALDGGKKPADLIRYQQNQGARRRLLQRFQERIRGIGVKCFGRMNQQHPVPVAMCGKRHEIGDVANLFDLDFLALFLFFGVRIGNCFRISFIHT